jgi:hypothetical protein
MSQILEFPTGVRRRSNDRPPREAVSEKKDRTITKMPNRPVPALTDRVVAATSLEGQFQRSKTNGFKERAMPYLVLIGGRSARGPKPTGPSKPPMSASEGNSDISMGRANVCK